MTDKETLELLVDSLRNQIKMLEEQNRKQEEANALHLKRISEQTQQISELNDRIKELLANMEWLKRKVFGKMSEKHAPINPNQLELPFDDADLKDINAEIEAAMTKAEEQICPKQQEDGKKARRNRIVTDGLPVVEVIIEPDGLDFTKYRKIGEEHTKTLEIVPGKVYVKDTIRPKYALIDPQDVESKGVIIAPMPLMPIYKGMPGASMLAEILLQKYQYHVPFYRQIQEYKHLGIKLSNSTLDSWFKPTCDLLRPLYLELKKKVLSTDYIQVDETTVPVIDREKHKAAKEYLWLVRSPMEKMLFFHYDEGSRSQKVALNLLSSFKGYVQSDGYAAYDAFEGRDGVCLVGCMAHIRRHFEACLEENREYSEQAIKIIQNLYNVERMADDDNLSYEERAALRQRLSGPLLDGFELWMKETYSKVLKRSLIGKAIAYAYPLMPRMRPYLSDGRLKIDNNGAENAIRPLTISRKNFLFCGNGDSAENTAVIMSLLGTCRECGVNPREWLNDVIAKFPYYLVPKSGKDLTELLPNRWAKANLE